MNDEARRIADRLRFAEMELQLAQRAFDGTEAARQRYAGALQQMEAAQRGAQQYVRRAPLPVRAAG